MKQQRESVRGTRASECLGGPKAWCLGYCRRAGHFPLKEGTFLGQLMVANTGDYFYFQKV